MVEGKQEVSLAVADGTVASDGNACESWQRLDARHMCSKQQDRGYEVAAPGAGMADRGLGEV